MTAYECGDQTTEALPLGLVVIGIDCALHAQPACRQCLAKSRGPW